MGNQMGPPIYMEIPPWDSGALVVNPFARQLQNPNPCPGFPVSREFIAGSQPIASQLAPMGDAQATRYQESVEKWTGRGEILPGNLYELARVFCPNGCHGILTTIETHLIGPEPKKENYNKPRNPFGWEADFGFEPRYFLRVEPPRLIDNVFSWPGDSGESLPGYAVPDLGVWYDSRYAWAETGTAYPLRIQMPEGKWIKLYQAIPSSSIFDATPYQIAGRLRAVVQAYRDNATARYTSRAGW